MECDRLPVTKFALSPTDVAQYVRLDRCDRYLRLRLHERSEGRGFLKEFGAMQQAIPPLLTLAGAAFEQTLESSMRRHYRVVNYQQVAATGGDGRVIGGSILVTPVDTYGGPWSKGFLFPSMPLPLLDKQRATPGSRSQ